MADLVVDISVGRSCGDESATHPNAISCRVALEIIRQHKDLFLVMTDEILDEWLKSDDETSQKYMSHWSRKWLYAMRSKQKVKHIIPVKINEFLSCANKNLIPQHLTALLKDIHLFYAAFSSDKKVISCDMKCWEHAKKTNACFPRIKEIHWANPNDLHFNEWLSSGALHDSHWRIP
jgi:hypothetical protein